MLIVGLGSERVKENFFRELRLLIYVDVEFSTLCVKK